MGGIQEASRGGMQSEGQLEGLEAIREAVREKFGGVLETVQEAVQ